MTWIQPKRRRLGFTLLEMVAAIAIGAMVLAIITIVVARMMRMEQKTRSQVMQLDSVSRLANQFRDDVHAADDVMIADKNPALTLTIDEPEKAKIEYKVDGRILNRLEERAGQVVGREGFRLPVEAKVAWTTEEVGDARFVRMRLLPDHRYDLVVVAQLSRNDLALESEEATEP